MADRRDRVDIPGVGEGRQREAAGAEPAHPGGGVGKPWLALWFRCAGQYARAYRNPEGTGYTGRCPRCGKSVRFAVGEGGTERRFFEVSC